MLTKTDYEELQRLAETILLGSSVKRKRGSALMWTLHVLLTVITFGGYRDFMSRFATTIFAVYIPEEWGLEAAKRVLPHELRHTVHCKRGFLIGYALFYLFFPLPVLVAWGRFWSELDADKTAWKAWLQERGAGAVMDILRHADARATSVCGRDYLWAWPKENGLLRYLEAATGIIREWDREAADGIIREWAATRQVQS